MSETKHTPLPWFWLDRDLVHRDSDETHHVVLDDGSAAGEYVPTIDPTGPDAQLIVTSVNARPKVEELLKAARFVIGEFVEMSDGRIEDTPKGVQQLSRAAREVEAALKGEA